MIVDKNTIIKDFSVYLRLAREAQTKAEMDYHIECAKSVLRACGIDIAHISNNPHIALEQLEQLERIKLDSITSAEVMEISEKVSVPYEELFAKIEGL